MKIQQFVIISTILAASFSNAATAISTEEIDEPYCESSGLAWAGCAGYNANQHNQLVTNSTQWWYDNIVPHIPEEELQYYQEPFGGAIQPSMYRSDLVGQVLAGSENGVYNEFQGIHYSHLMGGRTVGSRAPIHRHDFSATTHVLQGYVTLFLEGHAPKTYGPGESYYMPPGGLTMTAAVLPNPVYKRQLVQQAEVYSKNVDTNAAPIGVRYTDFVERETLPNGGYFYWVNGAYERCEDEPRYACMKEDYEYDEEVEVEKPEPEEDVSSASTDGWQWVQTTTSKLRGSRYGGF